MGDRWVENFFLRGEKFAVRCMTESDRYMYSTGW